MALRDSLREIGKRALINGVAAAICTAGTVLLVRIGIPDPALHARAALIGFLYYVTYRIIVIRLPARTVSQYAWFWVTLVCVVAVERYALTRQLEWFVRALVGVGLVCLVHICATLPRVSPAEAVEARTPRSR